MRGPGPVWTQMLWSTPIYPPPISREPTARTTIRFSYILQKSSACQSCVKRGIAYFKVFSYRVARDTHAQETMSLYVLMLPLPVYVAPSPA